MVNVFFVSFSSSLFFLNPIYEIFFFPIFPLFCTKHASVQFFFAGNTKKIRDINSKNVIELTNKEIKIFNKEKKKTFQWLTIIVVNYSQPQL